MSEWVSELMRPTLELCYCITQFVLQQCYYFFPKYRDKILPHCSIIQGCATNISNLPGICDPIDNIVYISRYTVVCRAAQEAGAPHP